MHRAAFLIALLLIPALITASANQDEPLASTAIGSQESPDTSLKECFVGIDTEGCEDYSSGDILLNWWSWSDETNSDWPDDDAKARAGELLLDDSESYPTLVTNEANSSEQAQSNRLAIISEHPIVTLSGELNLYPELDGHRIEIPVSMTPLRNLSDSTIMYIFLSKAYSVDHHSRELQNLYVSRLY